MRKKVASAASSALRRSFSRSAEQTTELWYPVASTARDSLVASTSGRTMDDEVASFVAARRRRQTTTTTTTSSTSLLAPRVSSAFTRQLHHSMSPAQGALPEVRLIANRSKYNRSEGVTIGREGKRKKKARGHQSRERQRRPTLTFFSPFFPFFNPPL